MSSPSRRNFLAAGATLSAASVLASTSSAAEDLSKIGKTPHSRFAVNVEMWFTKLPFLDRIRKSAELGFPAVEIWPFEDKDQNAVAELTQKLGIAVSQFTAWGFTPHMNDPKNEDAFIKKVEEACQVAHKWKCDKMCVVAGNNTNGMSQEAMHDQVIKALRRAAPIAEAEKVMLILEPMNGRVDHPGHCLYGSVDAVKICRAVDSPAVKINWDLYHMRIDWTTLVRWSIRSSTPSV